MQLFHLYKFQFYDKVSKLADCDAIGQKLKIGLDFFFLFLAAPPRAEMQTFAASEAGLEIGFSTPSMKSHFVWLFSLSSYEPFLISIFSALWWPISEAGVKINRCAPLA